MGMFRGFNPRYAQAVEDLGFAIQNTAPLSSGLRVSRLRITESSSIHPMWYTWCLTLADSLKPYHGQHQCLRWCGSCIVEWRNQGICAPLSFHPKIMARYVEAAQRPLNNRFRLVHEIYRTDPNGTSTGGSQKYYHAIIPVSWWRHTKWQLAAIYRIKLEQI